MKEQYTPQQLSALYFALKGSALIEDAMAAAGYKNRQLFKRQFYPSLDIEVDPEVHKVSVEVLKDNGVLHDVQLLTEILN